MNVYTNLAHAAGAFHVELKQRRRTGFLTAGQKSIKHKTEMKELAEALLLPESVAVIKCKGHDNSNTRTARGNQAADRAAKECAGYHKNI